MLCVVRRVLPVEVWPLCFVCCMLVVDGRACWALVVVRCVFVGDVALLVVRCLLCLYWSSCYIFCDVCNC